MRKIVINIDEKDFEIISNKVKDIRDEISNNGYANNDVLPIGWTSIADGVPLEIKQNKCNNCKNNTDELSGECYECVKEIKDWYDPIFDKDKSVKINGIETDFIIVDKNFIIDEFEKLKAEFEEDRYILLNQTVAIQIIDKYIAKLKGESRNDL